MAKSPQYCIFLKREATKQNKQYIIKFFLCVYVCARTCVHKSMCVILTFTKMLTVVIAG